MAIEIIKARKGQESTQIFYAFANVAASQTASSLVAAVAGKKIVVHGIAISCGAAACTATFNSGSTAISPLFSQDYYALNGLPFSPGGWFETAVGAALTVTTGAGSTQGFLVAYSLVK